MLMSMLISVRAAAAVVVAAVSPLRQLDLLGLEISSLNKYLLHEPYLAGWLFFLSRVTKEFDCPLR